MLLLLSSHSVGVYFTQVKLLENERINKKEHQWVSQPRSCRVPFLTCRDGKVASTLHIAWAHRSNRAVTNPLRPNNAHFRGLPTSHTSSNCSSGLWKFPETWSWSPLRCRTSPACCHYWCRQWHRWQITPQDGTSWNNTFCGIVYNRIEFRSIDIPHKHTVHCGKACLFPKGCCPFLPQQILASHEREVWFPKCQIC